MVTIRLCRDADVPDVLAWLDRHWKAGHIFAVHRPLFDWQHRNRERADEYSFAIARRDADDVLLGVLGFVPTRHFDPSLAGDNTLWLALWKVRDDVETGGLGLRLVRFVMDAEPHTGVGVLGFNPDVRPLYEALGFSVHELQHYVMANPELATFALASFTPRRAARVPDTGLTATVLDQDNYSRLTTRIDLRDRNEQAPRKTVEYFRARYLDHPVYRYRCLMLHRGAQGIALVAIRVARVGGHCALRVVDYVGPADAVAQFGSVIQSEIRQTGAEYADVYNWGLAPHEFERGGFTRVDLSSEIVPDHFEPFEKRNVQILAAWKGRRPVVLFKGDADQDRPSEVPTS